MNAPDPFAAITDAVKTAASTAGLDWEEHADLRGASVTGKSVQAYVVPRGSGFQVEMWYTKRSASDPYKVTIHAVLAEAVAAAISAASR